MRAASEASRLMCGVFAALIVAVTSAVVLTRATAQQAARAPDFSSNFAGWVAIEPDFIPVPETVPPVTFDRRYPYVSNAAARRQGISADVPRGRSHPSQHQALGEGAHETGQRQGARRRDRLYRPIELPAGGRAGLPDVPGGGTDLLRPRRRKGHCDLCRRCAGAAHLSRRAAFAQSEAVMVWRVGRPLRGRHAGGRHHRPEHQDLCGPLPHAAHREAARRGALAIEGAGGPRSDDPSGRSGHLQRTVDGGLSLPAHPAADGL